MYNRVILTFMAFFLIFLSGCDLVTAQNFVDLDCGSEAEKTFEDWRSWTKVNPTPLLSEGHQNSYVDVFVDDLAKDTYLTVSAPYPECVRIVKAHYTDESATKVDVLAVMVKMPPGYDLDMND